MTSKHHDSHLHIQHEIKLTYTTQDQTYISVPKPTEIQSGPSVVKKLLNIQCYVYLWHKI